MAKELPPPGWKSGTVQEFCGLTVAQMGAIETAVVLQSEYCRRLEAAGRKTADLVEQIGEESARSLEDGAPTLTALFEGLLALGATFEEIGAIVGRVTLPRE